MRVEKKLLLILTVLLGLVGADTPDETATVPGEGRVVICRIEGEINDGILILVQRALREAAGAQALIFEIDTFGGRVDSTVDIANAILSAECDTIAYVRGRGAISAGAIISYACNHITMEPASTIGDAQPVIPSTSGAMPLGEKETSFVRAKIRALAEANGHNPDIAAAMVDQRVVLRGYPKGDGTYDVRALTEEEVARINETLGKQSDLARDVDRALEHFEDASGIPMEPVREIAKTIAEDIQEKSVVEKEETAPAPPASLADGSILVDSEETLLTLTTDEALRYGLIVSTCNSVDEVMGLHGHGGLEKVYVSMTGPERFAWWLMTSEVSAILLLMGVAGIYWEIRTPGFGLPGILGIVCLGLFFGARYVIGLAEIVDLLLLATGTVLILVEIFVLPGFGIAGISGILCFLVGGYLALTNVVVPEYSWDFERLNEAARTVVLAMVAGVVWSYFAVKYLPKTPMGRKLVVEAKLDAAKGYTVQSVEDERASLGLKGVAETVLRPAGRARFNGKLYDVVAIGDYIEPGSAIEIVEVKGNRYVVDLAKEETHGRA